MPDSAHAATTGQSGHHSATTRIGPAGPRLAHPVLAGRSTGARVTTSAASATPPRRPSGPGEQDVLGQVTRAAPGRAAQVHPPRPQPARPVAQQPRPGAPGGVQLGVRARPGAHRDQHRALLAHPRGQPLAVPRPPRRGTAEHHHVEPVDQRRHHARRARAGPRDEGGAPEVQPGLAGGGQTHAREPDQRAPRPRPRRLRHQGEQQRRRPVHRHRRPAPQPAPGQQTGERPRHRQQRPLRVPHRFRLGLRLRLHPARSRPGVRCCAPDPGARRPPGELGRPDEPQLGEPPGEDLGRGRLGRWGHDDLLVLRTRVRTRRTLTHPTDNAPRTAPPREGDPGRGAPPRPLSARSAASPSGTSRRRPSRRPRSSRCRGPTRRAARPRATPASSSTSQPSGNGKNASEAATDPGTRSPARATASRAESTRLTWPIPTPTVAPSGRQQDRVGLHRPARPPGERQVGEHLGSATGSPVARVHSTGRPRGASTASRCCTSSPPEIGRSSRRPATALRAAGPGCSSCGPARRRAPSA